MNPRAPNLKLRWRLIGVAGALAALAALAVACAPAPPAPPPPKVAEKPAEKPAVAPVPKIEYGSAFVFADSGNVANCYTYAIDTRAANIALDHVYELLVRFDYNNPEYRGDLPLVPWLAEKWEQPDPTTYIFHLRKGVKWHDGKPFTTDDVLATIKLVMDKNFRGASTWRPFTVMEKVDDTTLKFVTGKPAPMALAGLAQPSDALIYPKHIIDAGTLEKACVGTGPFFVKSTDPASKMVQERFKDYWRKDEQGNQQPYLDKIEMIFNMDRSAQQAGAAARELDLYSFNTYPELEAFLKQVKDLQVITYHSHHTVALLFNMTRKPFDDINVRKALNLLVDRHEIMETVTYGKGLIGLPVVPAIKKGWGISQEELLKMPGFRKDKTQDVAEAKKLLEAAGLGSGFKFDLLYIKTWSTIPLSEFIPGHLKKYGMEVVLRGVDEATNVKEMRAGNYDTVHRLVGNFDPLLRTDEFFYSKSGQAKVTGVTDKGQDALIDQLRTEMDPKKQKELVRKIQEIVVNTYWTIPYGDPAFFQVIQPWVQGYRPTLSVRPDLAASAWQIWVEKAKLPAKRKG